MYPVNFMVGVVNIRWSSEQIYFFLLMLYNESTLSMYLLHTSGL